jgi:hypothetical protein
MGKGQWEWPDGLWGKRGMMNVECRSKNLQNSSFEIQNSKL